jgi:hypothetical protein
MTKQRTREERLLREELEATAKAKLAREQALHDLSVARLAVDTAAAMEASQVQRTHMCMTYMYVYLHAGE